jgi:hypothetical protein
MLLWVRGGRHWLQAAQQSLGFGPYDISVLLVHEQKIAPRLVPLITTTEKFSVSAPEYYTRAVRVGRETVLVFTYKLTVSFVTVRRIAAAANAGVVGFPQQK